MDKLKEKVLKAQHEGDIASLYVLEQQAHELFDEETLIAYYANILELALENLTDALEAPRKMNIEEVQDYATLRALYEYAIEHYSAGKPEDAAALFEVLGGLTTDTTFMSSMSMHQKAIKAKLSLDDFIEKIADVDQTQSKGTFYISAFNKSAQKLLEKVK